MRRFLRYELDRYLSGRGSERIEELPLMLVENQQYIHYRKGSLAMYALRDYIGEEPLNRALAAYVAAVKFQEPPYTYTREFLDYIQQAVPADRQGILDDLFRNITLYDNRALDATWTKRDDGKYVVSVKVAAAKYRADGQGKETPATLDDWIDIGVFGDKEPKGSSQGKLLSLEKHHIDRADETFTVVVDAEPKKAGIDPLNKLIDRNPDNNLMAVTAGAPAAAATSVKTSG
jgi:aminopeptidase N